MIVLKIGGSSVDCAASIERVAEIIRGHLPRRPVIVVSAMAKTTRKLLTAAEAAAAGDLATAHAVCNELAEFHRREAHGAVPAAGRAVLDGMLDPWFNELRTHLDELAATRALTPRAADAVASYGELLSSAILSFALTHAGMDAAWIDCRRVIVTDHQFTRAQPLYGPTDARLRDAILPLLRDGKVAVLGGYVGSTLQGITTTLGKEGSDFSAAIVGAALGAEEVLIWTDVDGILTADPRLHPAARRVRTLSFGEALELACSGSKKPHYGTLGPASRADVPIRILNSRHVESEGTLIGRRDLDAAPTIKSIACRTHDHLLALTRNEKQGDGFLSRVLAACERFRPALLLLEAEEEAAVLALEKAERLAEVRPALKALGTLRVEPGRTVISLVSDDLATSPELAGRALAAAADFAPHLVLGGAAPAVRLTAEADGLARVIADLHAKLLPGDPEEVVP